MIQANYKDIKNGAYWYKPATKISRAKTYWYKSLQGRYTTFIAQEWSVSIYFSMFLQLLVVFIANGDCLCLVICIEYSTHGRLNQTASFIFRPLSLSLSTSVLLESIHIAACLDLSLFLYQPFPSMAIIWILLWPSSGSFNGHHLDPSMAIIWILLWPSSGSFYGHHLDFYGHNLDPFYGHHLDPSMAII